MQSLLIFNPDFRPFEPTVVERAFRSCPEFTALRFEEPGGALLECNYIEPQDWTIIRLNRDATTISLNQTWGAALRAVLLLQKALGVPLRMVNDDFSFDLIFSDIATVEALESAMENARTS
jgi:hypothetical protein